MIQIGVDFEGWPVNAMNLKQILKDLGFKEEDGKVFIKSDSPILDAYPLLLEDDGMAYGINPQFVIEIEKNFAEVQLKDMADSGWYDDSWGWKCYDISDGLLDRVASKVGEALQKLSQTGN